jgi:aryl-alcohol dehydrogenase-like predicted oxidoreductase
MLSLACSLAAVADVAVASGNATIQIAPGVFMPMISVGHPDDGKRNETAAALAWLRAGGRGIDTALDYHNQAQVGAALRASGVARADVFVTTKIPCQPGTESAASKAIREDLAQLELPYVDLLLIHFPCKRTVETQNVWRALQSAHANGLARAMCATSAYNAHRALPRAANTQPDARCSSLAGTRSHHPVGTRSHHPVGERLVCVVCVLLCQRRE